MDRLTSRQHALVETGLDAARRLAHRFASQHREALAVRGLDRDDAEDEAAYALCCAAASCGVTDWPAYRDTSIRQRLHGLLRRRPRPAVDLPDRGAMHAGFARVDTLDSLRVCRQAVSPDDWALLELQAEGYTLPAIAGAIGLGRTATWERAVSAQARIRTVMAA